LGYWIYIIEVFVEEGNFDMRLLPDLVTSYFIRIILISN
jgi:hypothetical protein